MPSPPLRATGATWNVDRLVSITARLRAARTAAVQGHPTQAAQAAAEVMVCARGGGGMLRERCTVLRRLRAAGVAAEVLPRATPSVQEQYAHVRARGARVLVMLGSEFLTNDCVKVRHCSWLGYSLH